MAVQTDFMAAVNQIAAERNIDGNEVVEAIAEAIAAGFRQDYPADSGVNIKVQIEPGAGTIAVIMMKEVVEKVENEYAQISLKEAQKVEPDIEVGQMFDIDITPSGDFGRVAAQSAKQIILQKIREAERETQLREFTDKIGTVEYAVVQRMDGDSVIWEVGRAIALMPNEDRIPGEFYKSGTRHKVLLKEITELARGRSLIVSRADAGFLQALFLLEVPELTSGSVEIKSIAREAGSRSKVAVTSHVDGIDPIGSFVGQRGIRINAVTNELRFDNREEKIDVILWDEKIESFLANSLSPATVKKVEIVDDVEKIAKLIVPNDQLSLAIGRDGQNVRLAAKLTGWKLDIEGEDGGTAEVDAAEAGATANIASGEATATDATEEVVAEVEEQASTVDAAA